LKLTLEANRLSFADVINENVYAMDLDAFIRNKEIQTEFCGESFPAATWVQVQRLYLPSFVVEVELTAESPK
jgi:enamine deaminase RidA (YjgF/YER057c/UK114 family)